MVVLNPKVLRPHFRKCTVYPLALCLSYIRSLGGTGRVGGGIDIIALRVSRLLKIQWPGLSGDTCLLYVATHEVRGGRDRWKKG